MPTVTITASPQTIASGASSTLTWSSTNATSCTASGSWSGDRAPSGGSESTGVLTASANYTLTCTGDGGSENASATVTVTPTGANSYTTHFPLTENPVSEGGRWINGGTVGLDWTDVTTTPGLAIGTQSGASFTDSTALLTGTWGPDQTASGAVHTVNQNDRCAHEIEFRFRSLISANVNRGYEVGFHMSQTSDAYIIIVRWNGSIGDFNFLLDTRGTQFAITDGDTISASIEGDIITAYINGVEKASADITSLGGTVWTDGNPGMGFNLENAPFGCSGTNGDYGFTSFTATDAAAVPLSLSSHREMSQPQVLESQDAAWFADPPPTALSIDDFDLVQHPVGNSGPDGGGNTFGSRRFPESGSHGSVREPARARRVGNVPCLDGSDPGWLRQQGGLNRREQEFRPAYSAPPPGIHITTSLWTRSIHPELGRFQAFRVGRPRGANIEEASLRAQC